MVIFFKPLQNAHFPLLLKWLESLHVKAWWDQDVHWASELIEKKYTSYVQGFKRLVLENRVIKKPIHAFIIHSDEKAVGYIQYYNAYDFPREQGYEIEGLPTSLASLDVFIGESEWIHQGLGPIMIDAFFREQVLTHFDACFVDPDPANTYAILAYEKAGFKKVKTIKDETIIEMVRMKSL